MGVSFVLTVAIAGSLPAIHVRVGVVGLVSRGLHRVGGRRGVGCEDGVAGQGLSGHHGEGVSKERRRGAASMGGRLGRVGRNVQRTVMRALSDEELFVGAGRVEDDVEGQIR